MMAQGKREMSKFWRPRPREPLRDWRTYALLVPTLVSAMGFFMTGVFAFAFSDIYVIPARTQSWLVIWGSALIIWGAELNTPFVFIEAFRKVFTGEYRKLDISALVCSLIGTGANLLVAFASRMSNPSWQAFALNWGPVVGGLAVVLDYYGAGVEVGFLFGSYEQRIKSWLDDRAAFEDQGQGAQTLEQAEATARAALERVSRLEDEIQKRDRPVCGKEEFMAGVNGRGAGLDRASALAIVDQELDRSAPHPATLARWLGEARIK